MIIFLVMFATKTSTAVNPPFSFQTKYSKNFLTLAKTLEDTIGVDIAVENMFPWK